MAFFDIDERLSLIDKKIMSDCSNAFSRIESISEYNGQKVLSAFIKCGVSEMH